MKKLREKIIRNAIKNLKEFGYGHVTENDLFNSYAEKEFFKSMIESSIDEVCESNDIMTDKVKVVLEELLKELN